MSTLASSVTAITDALSDVEKPKDIYLYIGSFSSNIKYYKLNYTVKTTINAVNMNARIDTSIELMSSTDDMNTSPSYIIQSYDKKYIYATCETGICIFALLIYKYIY